MTYTYRAVNFTIRGITKILCRIDNEPLKQVPLSGPLIMVGNHINFLEAPVLYPRLQPRRITGFVKSETWNNFALGLLFDLWGAIPIRRGEADINAMRQALHALEDGEILALSPEGTRSGDGCLLRGHPGVVSLALRSCAPILPMVIYGSEKFKDNLARLQRTDFHIVVGNIFYLDNPGMRTSGPVRQEITDEIMFQISALLPSQYRGYYADLHSATERFLKFPINSRSNLSYGTSIYGE
jgi:1-acyl-sn-glycerol-3-phosphate acyltransferase